MARAGPPVITHDLLTIVVPVAEKVIRRLALNATKGDVDQLSRRLDALAGPLEERLRPGG